jgi:hypothetical protein
VRGRGPGFVPGDCGGDAEAVVRRCGDVVWGRGDVVREFGGVRFVSTCSDMYKAGA